MNPLLQQALQILNKKKNDILQGAMQLGKGYLSTPQRGQPEDQAFQIGQGLGMMPPNTGIGAGDDILRLAMPLIAGITKGDDVMRIVGNVKKTLAQADRELMPFEDFYTAKDILNGLGQQKSSVDDYIAAGDTIKAEALRQLTGDEYRDIWKTKGLKGIIDKTMSRMLPEEKAILQDAKNLAKAQGVIPKELDLSKAKITKEWGFPKMKEITTEISLDDIPKRSITTPEYRDYDINLRAGKKITKPLIATIRDINDPNSPIEIVDGWHRWRQAVANKDKTIPIKYIFGPSQSTRGVKK